jgi:hypothetical protein
MNVHQKIIELEKLIVNLHLLRREILSHQEAAKYIGISESYLYKLKDQITYSCPTGKLKFYQRKDLDAYMLRGRRKSTQEIINEVN